MVKRLFIFGTFVVCLFLGNSNGAFAQTDSLYSSHFQTVSNTIDSLIAFSIEEEIDSLIAFSKEFIGLKYRYGNNTPEGFDCSGFTSYVFAQFGYPLGRSSSDQYKNGVSVTKEEMKAGDLVFFQERNRDGTYRINHVGIIISTDTENLTFRFIHSSTSHGVMVDNSTTEYYQKRFCGIRRIIGN